MRRNHLEFPRRVRGLVKWGPADSALVHHTLTNPAYTGDYVFQRYVKSANGMRRRPPAEWIVVKDHHEPYVARPDWQRIRDMLSARRPNVRPLVGKGGALLQGLLRCAACDRWMRTQYWGRQGTARTADYVCRRVNGWGDVVHSVSCPARIVDHAVIHQVLAALTPVEISTALEVIQGAVAEQSAIEKARQRQLQTAEEAVEQARRVYLAVGRENRRVKADLEAKYETALHHYERLKAELSAPAPQSVKFTPEDASELLELTHNVRQLWEADTTTNEDRKRLLRTVLSEIYVRHADKEAVDLEIIWAGGLRQPLRALRPQGVDAFVREKREAGKSTREITDELCDSGVITASGRPMSVNVVYQKLRHLGLPLSPDRLAALQMIRQGLMNGLRRGDILARLKDDASPRLGPWNPQRLANEVYALRKGISGIEPLPDVLPEDLEAQNVLRYIEEGRKADHNWVVIAARLNASGLKPQRAKTFTPVQIQTLYARASRRAPADRFQPGAAPSRS